MINENKPELYYYSEEGAVHGPFGLEELVTKIKPDTLVFKEDGVKWDKAEDIPEVKALLFSPEPTPEPTPEPVQPENNVTPEIKIDSNIHSNSSSDSSKNKLVVIGVVFILVIVVMSINKYSPIEDSTLSTTDSSSFKASNDTNDQTNVTVTKVNPVETVEKDISENSKEDKSDAGVDYGDYVKYSNETIFDKVNNRFWFIAPDRDFNYFEAMNFINDINGNQSEFWRLPSFEEIKSLYDENSEAGQGFYRNGHYYPARVNSVFNSIGSGSWFWISDESENSDRANAINLHEGIEVGFNKNKPQYPVHLLLTKNN